MMAAALTKLVRELRRRRIFRTAAWYIVASWLAMQVADVMLPALDIEERAIRYLLIAAVLGFPVALVFGWFYDVSANGIRRTGPASEQVQSAAQPLQRRDYIAITALAMVLGAILLTAANTMRQMPGPTEVAVLPAERSGPPMLAVLPFASTSLDDDSAFFATGMHDDLLTQLAQLQNIRVVSRTSVMEFKGVERNLRKIGATLGADAILEGGIQSSGGQIRINMQLIDSRTDEHLWAKTFDRSLTAENVFTVQSEIARAITAAMRATLTEQDQQSLSVIPTQNMAAYRSFHRALQLRYDPDTEPYDKDEEIAVLEQAVALDPGFTRAWAELVYPLSYLNYYMKNDASVTQAELALEQLRKLAPDSAEYLLAQAYFTYYVLRGYETALLLVDQALQRMPSDVGALQLKTMIQRRMGDDAGRIETLRLLMTLDPRNDTYRLGIMSTLWLQHRYDEVDQLLGPIQSAESAWLASKQNLLKLREHGDLQRWARDELALADEFTDNINELDALIVLLGDYAAVRAEMEDWPPEAERANLSGKQFSNLMLLKMEGDTVALSLAVREARSFVQTKRDQMGEWEQVQSYWDLALISAVSGEREEAERQMRRWMQEADRDQTTFRLNLPLACQTLGLAGSPDAVACLRRGLEEPSAVVPFFEPNLPYYDAIRETPEFIALLAEIET